MPPSQLKKLKASLRESGVVGPQKSKKQKKQASRSGALKESRIQRNESLHSIRQQFAPFEVKAPTRNKFDFVSRDGITGKATKGVVGRPGVTKGMGEEQRRRTLLPQMQRRNKVGGIQDRRFGENDPTMTPEERNLQRYMRAKQKGDRKASIFNLEEDDGLTHFGRPLTDEVTEQIEDFDEADLGLSDGADEQELDDRPRKRQRLSDDEGDPDGTELDMKAGEQPERRKTKNEVMKEVMAKSKLHKYERQQAKEDDDDLRAELDKGMPDLFALLRGEKKQPPPAPEVQAPNGIMNADRLALLNGKDRAQADREYDERLKEYTFDQRSRPTVRTLTEEEKLEQEAQKLKDLEERRLKRMKGEPESDAEQAVDEAAILADGDQDPEESDVYGLGAGIPSEQKPRLLDVEDEDDFLIEDDLVASGSDLDISDPEDGSEPSGSCSDNDDDDLEFVQGLLSKEDAGRPGLNPSSTNVSATTTATPSANLPFTFPCPQTHAELLAITSPLPITDLPTVIQRIRALYQPKLSADKKSKLAVFSTILVSHLSHLANKPTHPPFSVLEALIRHIHSLAKTYPSELGRAFRDHLTSIQENRPLALESGDLILLTAISTIFPTSDHFHQVVTPAMLCMTRYLGHKIPQDLSDLATGTYVAMLCVQYQRLAKRYVPEVVNYTLNALWALVREEGKERGSFVKHKLPAEFQISANSNEKADVRRKFAFWDTIPSTEASDNSNELKHALLRTHLRLIGTMAEMWSSKSAFIEIFDPVIVALKHIFSQAAALNLPTTTHVSHSLSFPRPLTLTPHQDLLQSTLSLCTTLSSTATSTRRPLALHNHRPLPIKTSIPKFEPSYNPTSHYDPDRQRSELSKLKSEHKKERKGALRELRKDANFVAREGLREKRERDEEYERKMRRLVGMVQGEEGREGKEYERERRMRKAARGRGRGR